MYSSLSRFVVHEGHLCVVMILLPTVNKPLIESRGSGEERNGKDTRRNSTIPTVRRFVELEKDRRRYKPRRLFLWFLSEFPSSSLNDEGRPNDLRQR